MAHILIFIHWFVLVFTFGNVELVTIDNSKSNDFPIEELNGYTLREVFENGNLVRNITPSYFNLTNISYQNYNLIGSASAVDGEHYTDFRLDSQLINDNDILYAYSIVKNISGKYRMQIYMWNGVSFDLVNGELIDSLNNTSLQLNVISSYTQGSGFIYRHRLIDDLGYSVYVGSNEYYYLLDIGIVNQTTLGISSLTVEQMNDWFNVYQENEQREIGDTYDYIENELTTNDLIYIVLFALLWGLAIKIVKGVM